MTDYVERVEAGKKESAAKLAINDLTKKRLEGLVASFPEIPEIKSPLWWVVQIGRRRPLGGNSEPKIEGEPEMTLLAVTDWKQIEGSKVKRGRQKRVPVYVFKNQAGKKQFSEGELKLINESYKREIIPTTAVLTIPNEQDWLLPTSDAGEEFVVFLKGENFIHEAAVNLRPHEAETILTVKRLNPIDITASDFKSSDVGLVEQFVQ